MKLCESCGKQETYGPRALVCLDCKKSKDRKRHDKKNLECSGFRPDRLVRYKGILDTVQGHAKRANLNPYTVTRRYHSWGSIEVAIETPIGSNPHGESPL